MEKGTKSQFTLQGRNAPEETNDSVDTESKNYSTNPKSQNSIPKKSATERPNENDDNAAYNNAEHGNKLKNDNSGKDPEKYKMMDYGSTGNRSQPNKKND